MKKLLIILWIIGYMCSVISYIIKGNKEKFIIRTLVYGLLLGLTLGIG